MDAALKDVEFFNARVGFILIASKNIFCIIFIIVAISCGGGGGKYYPPKVSINKNGIVKKEVTAKNLNIKTKFIVNTTLDELDQQIGNKINISGVEYYAVNEFDFSRKHFFLGIPHGNFVNIINSDERIIKKLDTPRYPLKAIAIQLVGKKNNRRYLAVYIQQQATSHSSTLYILNSRFDVVYKEHLLGALWMARESTLHGHDLIISAETKWSPKGKWISIGGPWRYVLFN